MMEQWIDIFDKYENKYGVFFDGIKDSNYPLYVESIIANAGMLNYSNIDNFDELDKNKLLKKKNLIGMGEGCATLSKKGIKELIKYLQA